MTSTPHRHTLPESLSQVMLSRLADQIAASPSADLVTVRAPYSNLELATLPLSNPADVATVFAHARMAQEQWAKTTARHRRRIFLRFHDLLLERTNEGLDLIQTENGKTRRDAMLEIVDVANTARYYARSAAGMLKPKRRRGAIPFLTRTTELRHPVGVVGMISPWNYPLSLAAGDAIPAFLAGNAVVHKPDTQTALTALWVRSLLIDAGLPESVWQIVLGRGREIGDAIIGNADYLMFTGSTEAGRKIAAAAASRLIGSSLELGGKNAMIVLDDADLNAAAQQVISGAFASSGQLCISIERLYVPARMMDDVCDRLEGQVASLRLGASYDFDMDIGSLTNQSQLEAVARHIDDAVGKGAKILTGGRPRPDLGPYFFEPTILTGVTPGMLVFAEETFSPVLSIYPYDTIEEAIALANDSRYGLNASVIGRNTKRARSVASRLRAGSVNVNDGFSAAWGSVDAPIGGWGDSGLGRRHGREGLLKYTESQTIAQPRLVGSEPPRDLEYARWAAILTRGLKLLKLIGYR